MRGMRVTFWVSGCALIGISAAVAVAGVHERAKARELRTAPRTAGAELRELPIPAGLAALHSGAELSAHGNFAPHWGTVATTHDLDLHSNLDAKIDSSVPWRDITRIIEPDNDGDGTLWASKVPPYSGDDLDHDGTIDFAEWLFGGNVEDPWLRFWAGGSIFANGGSIPPGCATDNCQPAPWWNGFSLGNGFNDHSNLFQNVTLPTFPAFDYELWKSIARSGDPNLYYYASDGPGTGTYRLDGRGPSVTVRDATNGRQGLFFFDTADNGPPFDADCDGTFDNLADPIVLSDVEWTTGGLLYLNADLRTSGTGTVASPTTVMAPGEPYIDADFNGQYDPDEWFVELTYPSLITGTYAKSGLRRAVDGYTRKVPADDASVGGRYELGVNVYGVLYTNGAYDAQGNWTFYGSVLARQGVWANGGGGTPHFYFDERLADGRWPPSDMTMPSMVHQRALRQALRPRHGHSCPTP